VEVVLVLDGVEGAGEFVEHDPDLGVGSVQGGVGLLQQVDDCIINPKMGLICKLLGSCDVHTSGLRWWGEVGGYCSEKQ